jgi:excinuclease ABC subunit C
MSETEKNNEIQPEIKLSPDLKSKLENLPASPGVYQFKDSEGKVLYVGKAKSLRNRVRSYFQARSTPVRGSGSARLDMMMRRTADVELITTNTEVEALLLEITLIQKLKPKYNVNFKDDKSYPYIVITNEPFPRVFPTRKKRSDGSRYFGPYTDVKTMRFALKAVRDIFMIRSCSLNLTDESIATGKFKVCLDYHIKKCEGPCEGLVTRLEYNEMINEVARLLQGKTKTLIHELESKMNRYSEEMKFEKAAQIRDKIGAIEVYSERQNMVDEETVDRDVFAVAREDNTGCGMVLKIRDGKVIGKSHFYLSNVLEKSDAEVLENFVITYYSKSDFIPDEVLLENELLDPSMVKQWLEERRGSRVDMTVPKIGDKAKSVNMVKSNATFLLKELLLSKMKKEFIPPSLEALKRDLRLTKLPRRIECFDISHIQGTDTVASMVVFENASAKKTAYRKFKLRGVEGMVGRPDDFMSMREVIHRRYKKVAEAEFDKSLTEDNKEKQEKDEALQMPDLIIIDGGKGQLSSAVKVLDDLGIKDQNIIGLAKRLEEVYLPGDSEPQSIPHTSSGLRLLQRIRDEAHRFAITYHRTLRDKRTFATELTEIEGIGAKTAKKLLTEFGSVEKVKEMLKSDYSLLEKTAGKKVAARLKEYYS